ncbi:hypothetical protein MXB_1081 [Myxobolus squamalis]|nr:hypothetical protein MXB_1081 [Myxobolus squamalis]
MGKFYELFHMDADIGVKELGLTYMKGKYAHAGFPETSFAIHASALVEKGYKVARIEQTEKPSDVSVRIKETGSSEASGKVVRRDLCSIISPATRIFDCFDLEVDSRSISTSNQTSIGFGLLMSVVELASNSLTNTAIKLGVCILDSSIANSDESFNSHLSNLPPVLHDLVKSGDVVEDSVLSLSALGSIIHLLRRCLVDEQILSSGTFSIYFPDDYPKNVVVNSEGYIGKYGTILSLVNHCMTSSGKRCMTNLVCHPLYHKKDIEERLDAIERLLTLDGQEMTNLRKDTFKGSFDVKNAKKEAVIIPHKGFIAEYDASFEKIERIELKLAKYLDKLKKLLNCKNIKYWGSDRSRYLIEIPTDIVSGTNFLSDFEFKSQRKGFKRYSSPKCQNLFSELIIAEESKKSALQNRLSMIDCLVAFSYFSSGVVTNGILTRPMLIESPTPLLEIKDGYHPCLSTVKTNIVSNSISMGTSNENMFTTLLITGPNMGGKSTLMRQTAIIVILAQLGCYVPCSSCILTPVDRIFARLGASFDHPNSGESTFYVELAETAVMIKQATRHSLILLDELGRGTATHDGLAIAFSILKDLDTSKILPIHMVFMECLVNDELHETNNQNRITFLYQVKNGICPKSYGFHVARLAGMNEKIVTRAIEMAKIMERTSLINELIQAQKNKKEFNLISLCKQISNL